MTDLIETVGPFLGLAAFLGLAVIAFLIFQQAREVRRLREWAGRAPERSSEAADASLAAAEARGDALPEPERERGPIGRWWDRVRAALRAGVGRGRPPAAGRSPIPGRRARRDPDRGGRADQRLRALRRRLDSGGGGGGKSAKEKKVAVAVLNATQVENAAGGETAAVEGLAARVADDVVRKAGFKPGKQETATTGFDETTIMYEPKAEDDANELAKKVSDQLGETPVTPMIDDVRSLSGDAPLALVIGADDAGF